MGNQLNFKMFSSLFVSSLLVASISAVKTTVDSQQPATPVATTDTTAPVPTSEEVQSLIDNFDPATILDWWTEVYQPFLVSQRDVVYDQVWSKIVDRDTPFMPDTCEAGE